MTQQILFFVSTIFWCQLLPIETLRLYAIGVMLTYIGKEIWLYAVS